MQPLTLYEFILFTTTTYGCLHVERINYSLSLLSHLYLTLTLTDRSRLACLSLLQVTLETPKKGSGLVVIAEGAFVVAGDNSAEWLKA